MDTGKHYPQRKSPRLRGYDYSQEGAYFVTICTYGRNHLFGDIAQDIMQLNTLGSLAYQELQSIPQRWQTVDVDLFVVMPNHLHVIIVLVGTAFLPSAETQQVRDVGTAFLPSAQSPSAQSPGHEKTDAQKRVPTLGEVIGNYKAGVTRLARQHHLVEDSARLWQERYHDHIIRDERSLENIRQYVVENPARWEADTFYS